MSSLAAALADLKPGRRTICWAFVYLPKMDDLDKKALEVALEDSSIQGSKIAEVLTAAGHPVNGSAIQRHRRGECACGDRR